MRCPKCGANLVLRTARDSMEIVKNPSLDRVRVALGKDANLCEFSQADGIVTVLPKHYLGKVTFARMDDVLEQFAARYISEGKRSRWEI